MKQARDWKFYDYSNEVHLPFERDPRSLETLTEAIIPGFELDGTSRSDPLPPHHPRLTQPDRQLSESSWVPKGGTKILMPHRDSSSVPNHLSVSNIMTKGKCSAEEARNLADAFAILNATEKMVNTYCNQVREKGAEAVLDYLYRYLIGIVEVEAEPREHTRIDEREPWEDEEVIAGEKLPGLFGKAGICEDVYVEKEELARKKAEGPMAIAEGNGIAWPEIDEDGNISEACEDDIESYIKSYDLEPEDNKITGSIIGYHIVEDLNEWQDKVAAIQRHADPDTAEWFQFNLPNEEKNNNSEVINNAFDEYCSWEAIQPKWYKIILSIIREADLPHLKEIGQKLHDSTYSDNQRCSKPQLSVLWTEWKSRKACLLPKHLGITARALLLKIAQADGHLGAIGVWLHKVQNREVKLSMPPNKIEWGIIWKEYFKAKEAHA